MKCWSKVYPEYQCHRGLGMPQGIRVPAPREHEAVDEASDVPPKFDYEVQSGASKLRTPSIRRPQSRPEKEPSDDMALLDRTINALAKMLSGSGLVRLRGV